MPIVSLKNRIPETAAKGGVRKPAGQNDFVVLLRAAAEPPQALRSQDSLLFAPVPPLLRFTY